MFLFYYFACCARCFWSTRNDAEHRKTRERTSSSIPHSRFPIPDPKTDRAEANFATRPPGVAAVASKCTRHKAQQQQQLDMYPSLAPSLSPSLSHTHTQCLSLCVFTGLVPEQAIQGASHEANHQHGSSAFLWRRAQNARLPHESLAGRARRWSRIPLLCSRR